MKKFYSVLIALMLISSFAFAMPALATEKSILISEVQTGTEISASQEFVEIYNNGNNDQDMSGWTFYYKSQAGSTWVKKATILSKILEPGSFYVFASNLQSDVSYSSTLAQSGGNIQIRDKTGAVVDQFGWGLANSALGQPASESEAGQSMYRMFDFDNNRMFNSDDNFNDYDVAKNPSMGALPEKILPELDLDPIEYLKLELSEIFPDPESPQSDSADEFIEIFNPQASDISLSGWKLKDESGTEFIIKDRMIISGSRISIPVGESKIVLNNTGDSIQLINPSGDIVDESANYGDAKEGLSWIKINGQWQWSVGATPDQPNSEAYSVLPTSASAAVKNVKKSTAKKTSSAKPKASKVKSSKSSTSKPLAPVQASKNQGSNMWTWLLLSAGIATIGYGIYEYRTEIQLQFNKLRSKF